MIATKLSIRDADSAGLLTGQALRQSVEQALRQSLQTLGVDVLELVQLHSLDTRFATLELLDLLAEYCQRGWVRYWGVTTYGEEAPLDALDHPELISALQIPYSALDRRMELKVIPRARAQGTGVVLRSVFPPRHPVASARLAPGLVGWSAPLGRSSAAVSKRRRHGTGRTRSALCRFCFRRSFSYFRYHQRLRTRSQISAQSRPVPYRSI